MRKIVVNTTTIRLGKYGENESTEIIFPFAKEWHDAFGSGVVQLVYKPSGETSTYLCDVTDDGTVFHWIIKEQDLVKIGLGACELRYIVDNTVVAKSQTYNTYVAESLSNPGPYSPPDWFYEYLLEQEWGTVS